MSEGNSAAEVASTQTPIDSGEVSSSEPVLENQDSNEPNEEIVDEGLDLEASPDETKTEKKVKDALRKKFKLKVDGEEFEEELDLGDEEAIKKHLQMSKAAQKRMQEKAQIEKDMQQLLEILKNDPDSVLAELGIDPDEHAKKRLQRKLDEMQKSPEQKEKEKFEAELKAAKEETDKLKKEKEDLAFQQMQEKYRQQFDTELDNALSGDPDIPKNAYVIKRITDLMLFAMENKMPNVKVKDIVPIVKQEIYSEWNQMFDNFSEDQLERAWGKKNIDRVRKALLKKQRQVPTTTNQVVETTKSNVVDNKKSERIPMKDFFKNIGRK